MSTRTFELELRVFVHSGIYPQLYLLPYVPPFNHHAISFGGAERREIPSASGNVFSQGPKNRKSASLSPLLRSRLKTATFPPLSCTSAAYPAAGNTYTVRIISDCYSAHCTFVHRLQHTVEDVPTTRQTSALATSLSMRSMCVGVSPNHTTPGLANSPHFEQCGSLFSSTTGSTTPASINASVPPNASQTGDWAFHSMWPQSSDQHLTSNNLPCISSM